MSTRSIVGLGVLGVGGFVVVLLVGIVIVAIAVGSGQNQASAPQQRAAAGSAASPSAPPSVSASPQSAPTPSAAPRPTAVPAPAAAPKPVITHKTVQESASEPFAQSSVDDPNQDVGSRSVTTDGQNGTLVSTWDVTYSDGVETGRTLVTKVETVAPVTEVTSVGSRQPAAPAPAPAAAAPAPAADDSGSGCDPNYDQACVPIASDVDCAGGSGNGPAYVEGPVHVIGRDIYKLDRDGDGWGCNG